MKNRAKVVIVGAGPAGASLAIRLARANFDVSLVEREKFPRDKLCGEFVSPECLEHFRELGVLDEMLEIGGDRIAETVFYSVGGKSIHVPTEWFGGDFGGALSISRSQMDLTILQQAKNCGVVVFEEASATDVLICENKVSGVKVRKACGQTVDIEADLTVDATGRAGVMGKILDRKFPRIRKEKKFTFFNIGSKSRKRKFVGFKAHLTNAKINKGVCEIYSFRGGYGGLSNIENGLFNHCFLIEAAVAREFKGDPDKIVENVVLRNKRAAEALHEAQLTGKWHAVSVDEFGKKVKRFFPGFVSVGDASIFIDPFTGSGMLIALESAELLANLILNEEQNRLDFSEAFAPEIDKRFSRRLFVSSLMRRASFSPVILELLISALSKSGHLLEKIARLTRKTKFVHENLK